MTKPVEKITIRGREYSRFIRHPKTVRDGTVRCIVCGQIDEPEHHDLTCKEALIRQGFVFHGDAADQALSAAPGEAGE